MNKLFAFLLFVTFATGPHWAAAQQGPITLVLHSGAGNVTRERIGPERQKAYEASLRGALRTGYAVLEKGGSALDAVEATLRVLEDDSLFNAGKGAVFTAQGRNELDASLMDGATGKAGAVAGVTVVRNPISAARAVLEKSSHVLLTGPGAEAFAREQGLTLVDPGYFRTTARYQEYLNDRKRDNTAPPVTPQPTPIPSSLPAVKPPKQTPDGSGRLDQQPLRGDEKFGTVGAVALDARGNLAAGTSTGGMGYKRWGRVGDSPLIGAGTFADNATCAVSCTGHGEYFIRSVVAYDISALMAYKSLSVQQAADEVVLRKLVARGGEGGVIALDRQGN